MKTEVKGYVVQANRPTRFLSRSGRFVRHLDRPGSPGITRAWVHQTDDLLLAEGDWAGCVAMFRPAVYDGTTRITGDAKTFEVFLRISSLVVR